MATEELAECGAQTMDVTGPGPGRAQLMIHCEVVSVRHQRASLADFARREYIPIRHECRDFVMAQLGVTVPDL